MPFRLELRWRYPHRRADPYFLYSSERSDLLFFIGHAGGHLVLYVIAGMDDVCMRRVSSCRSRMAQLYLAFVTSRSRTAPVRCTKRCGGGREKTPSVLKSLTTTRQRSCKRSLADTSRSIGKSSARSRRYRSRPPLVYCGSSFLTET